MMIRILVSFAVVALLAMSCKNDNYSLEKCLSKPDQDSLIFKIVRYTAKLPYPAINENKFEDRFDSYYRSVAADYDIRRCFVDKDSMYFLLVTRAAKSITPMRESIGIKLKLDSEGNFSWYEEVFRTWKMKEEVMDQRYPELFELMVKGESLEPYYPKYKRDQYIEFPDGRFYFDPQQRKWRDAVLESRGVGSETK
jgi:hypothetical protein